eukprot:GHVT01062244.1.p1 GENE.GHVT01062244.1~~GHVT01062244.1.p1  ORF type:complete len:178 (-),score=24.55 GHVT01062244.1:64-597(-)
MDPTQGDDEFYVRYYCGHKGKFGHEFIEFEFRPEGRLRYANNSNYKSDQMIRKEAYVSHSVMDELKRVISESDIVKEDDCKWPAPDRVGRQELEIVLGNDHISFTVRLAAAPRGDGIERGRTHRGHTPNGGSGSHDPGPWWRRGGLTCDNCEKAQTDHNTIRTHNRLGLVGGSGSSN